MKMKQWFFANLLTISLIFLVLGFVVMSIKSDETVNGNTFHQLTIAPILLLIGYSLVIFAIMKPTKKDL
jgi:uncharacterized membrane protein